MQTIAHFPLRARRRIRALFGLFLLFCIGIALLQIPDKAISLSSLWPTPHPGPTTSHGLGRPGQFVHPGALKLFAQLCNCSPYPACAQLSRIS